MRAYQSAILILLFTVSLFSTTSQAQEWIYTTVEEDNLWNLSEKHLDKVTRFKQLQKLNGIENPKRLQPGTRLRVPLKWIRSNPVPASIVEVIGSAELIKADGGIEKKLSSGVPIHLGDQIQSGLDSTVAIRFADNSILTLYSNSLVHFDHLSAHGDTGMVDSRLRLLKGRMDTRVTPATGPGSRFEIKTPSAISAVRGTEYRASVSDEGKVSNIEVLHGQVAVSGGDKQRLINAGYGTQVAQGEAPLAPKKLLASVQINQFELPIRTINWVLSWQPLKNAETYRFEISDDRNFDTILSQQISGYPRAALPDLPDGRYFARIRGIDALGLEGNNSALELSIDARPQAPIQLSPVDQKLFRGQSPELQWTASEEADHYRLEISSDSDFNHHLVDRMDVRSTRFDTSNLEIPGLYFWRVTSITADGELGPPGIIRQWNVKPIPKEITADMSSSDDGTLTASWPVGNEGQTYQVQLAEDDAFTQLEIDQVLQETNISFEQIKWQPRYLRVRAIEPDGYLGPWGATQKVIPMTDNTPLAIFGSMLLLIIFL